MKPITQTLIALLILAAMLVLPAAAANVTNPQEYYDQGSLVDAYFQSNPVSTTTGYNLQWSDNIGAFASLATARELRRQTILMEKQNELLAEQNELLRNQSKYPVFKCTSEMPIGYTSANYTCIATQL